MACVDEKESDPRAQKMEKGSAEGNLPLDQRLAGLPIDLVVRL
jgi:hypothetical protein